MRFLLIGSSILLVMYLFASSMAYTITALKCNAYANGKGRDWEVSFPSQCWIIVDGKKYTKGEYGYKFEGVLVEGK